ncbi:MAG TPA: hypothetical protein VN112_11790 [Ensifer sp.]|nr:hypothetical protein [Ensifer sp.]
MNKIVLEHYPVEKLPEDLRVGLPDTGSARVTVEVTQEEENPLRAFFGLPKDDAEIDLHANFKKLLEDFDAHPERYNHGTTMEEAVRRIRELRDEWDDE